MPEELYGIKIVGEGDKPIMIDHRGLLQSWTDTVIENIGPGGPIVIRIFLPTNVSYVRQLRLNLRFENFRAYDKSADNLGYILTTTNPTSPHSHTIAFTIFNPLTGTMGGTVSMGNSTSTDTHNGTWHSHGYTENYRYLFSHDHGSSVTASQEAVEAHSHDSNPHFHPMEQGIFQGGSTFLPENVTIVLNGNDIGKTLEDTEEDIALPVDELYYGWNQLTINSSSIGRLSVSYFIQVFVLV